MVHSFLLHVKAPDIKICKTDFGSWLLGSVVWRTVVRIGVQSAASHLVVGGLEAQTRAETEFQYPLLGYTSIDTTFSQPANLQMVLLHASSTTGCSLDL